MTYSFVRRACACLLLILAIQACTSPGPGATRGGVPDVQRTSQQNNVLNVPEAGDISPQALKQVIPQIAELRSEQKSVTLRPGNGFRVSSLKVLAYDSAGNLLGRLKQTDRDVQPRDVLAFITADIVQGKKPGVGYLELSAPLWAELGGSRPQPTVRIDVTVAE